MQDRVTARQLLENDENLRFLEEAEVNELTNLSPSTRYRMRKEGKFPQLVELSPHIRRNTLAQIRRWLTERAALVD